MLLDVFTKGFHAELDDVGFIHFRLQFGGVQPAPKVGIDADGYSVFAAFIGHGLQLLPIVIFCATKLLTRVPMVPNVTHA